MIDLVYHVTQVLFFLICGAFLSWMLYLNNRSAVSSVEVPLESAPQGEHA